MRARWSRKVLPVLLTAVLLALGAPALAHDFGGPTGPNPPPGGPPPCPSCCGGGGCGGCGGGGEPVNYWDGAERYYFTDFLVSGYMPLPFARSYDSGSQFDSALGYGWSFSFNHRLYRYPDGRVIIRKDCGARREFLLSGGAFVTPAGERGTLVSNPDGTYLFTEASGYKLLFDVKGRLSRVSDRFGNYLQITYDPAGRLPITGVSPYTPRAPGQRVVAFDYRATRVDEYEKGGRATGRFYTLAYDSSSGRLASVTDHTSRTWTYTQDSNGNLSMVQDPLGNVITYSYNDADVHNLTGVTGGPVNVAITYDTQGRVTDEIFGDVELIVAYTTPGTVTDVTLQTKTGGTVSATGTEHWEFGTNGVVSRFNAYDAVHQTTYPSRNAAGQPLTRNLYEVRSGTPALVQQTTYTYYTDGTVQSLVDYWPDDPKTVTRNFTYTGGLPATVSEYDNAAPSRVFNRDWLYQMDGSNPLWAIRYRRQNNPGTSPAAYDETDYTNLPNGQLSGITFPGGSTSTITNVNGYTTNVDGVTYGRDLRGNITTVTALGNTVTYTYDLLDRLKTVTTQGGRLATYTWTGLQLTQIAYPAYTITYSYDTVGRLLTAVETRGVDPPKTLFSAVYDKAAKTVTVTDANAATYSYSWDPLRVWQRVESPEQQAPFPSVFPTTSFIGQLGPDPVAEFFRNVVNQPGMPLPVTRDY